MNYEEGTQKLLTKSVWILLMCVSLNACLLTKRVDPDSVSNQTNVDQTKARPELANTQKANGQYDFTALMSKTNHFQQNKREISNTQMVLMEKAIEALHAKRYKQGLSFINDAQDIGALNSMSLVIKADLQLLDSQKKQAITSLQEAIEINPHNPGANARLAKIKREEGDFLGAEQLLNKAIEGAPTEANLYRNRGVLYDLYLGQKKKALEDYQVYYALLNHQNGLEDNRLKKQIKLTKLWIKDLERQLVVINKENK